MQLHPIDWFFIIGYCVVAFGIGIYFSRRASRSTEEYFVAGRTLPWWLAGTSIVATTFASDTPLVVSKLTRDDGIYGNWMWWGFLMGGMLCVVFFARLWRRAGVVTDIEFIELRYEGRQAAILRGFLSIYGGVLTNCITMMWVMLAMTKICHVMLGWDKVLSISVLVAVAVTYTVISGFWGVVMTDLIQFVMAMTGSIALAAIVLWDIGGPSGLVRAVSEAQGVEPDALFMTPFTLDAASEAWNAADVTTLLELPITTFVVIVLFMWWGLGQGGGYLAQRLFATKSEKDSMLAALWFNFAHYVIRPWPWIIVALASLAYFPLEGVDGLAGLDDSEKAYPMMMAKFLPTGLRGLVVASFVAAFMSTIDTQLNWGSSYLVNDLYKRFIRPGASERHYVNASRIACVVLISLAAVVAWQSKSILSAWIYLAVLGAGGAFVGLLRWYWWRVNVWSEISALLGSVVIANGGHLIWLAVCLNGYPMDWTTEQQWLWTDRLARIDWFYSTDLWAIRGFVVIVVCTILWIAVTLLTKPVSRAHLEQFYRRVRPGGWWGPVAAACPDVRRDRGLGKRWLAWVSGVTCVYAGLFGVGHLCLDRPAIGVVHLLGCLGAGWLMLTLIGAEERRAGTS